ncbi:MAG: CopG family transcriptional regulator [Elusimicrobiota bacterium]
MNKNIKISKELYFKIAKNIEDTGFKTVDSYVEYILNQVTSEEKQNNLTEEEEEKIKERLIALGYL